MELISYDEFARLRLAQFYPDASNLVPLENWEFMGGIWVGEADGFTEFLRPHNRAEELGSMEIDLFSISAEIGVAILDKIRLPIRRGMAFQEVTQQFGAPEGTDVFAADRMTHNFTVGSNFLYYVSCTIHDSNGLIHVTIIRKDLLPH